MKITKKWMQKVNACEPAYKMFLKKGLTDSDEILDWCIKHNKHDWASWMLTRIFKTKRKKVQYAIFAAELVLSIYERNTNSNATKKAIEAAKAYLNNPCSKTKSADAAYAAYAAYAYAADAAYSYAASGYAAYSYAAYSYAASAYAAAAYAASAASAAYASAAYASAYAAADAYASAADAAYASAAYASAADARRDFCLKIIDYGRSLLLKRGL